MRICCYSVYFISSYCTGHGHQIFVNISCLPFSTQADFTTPTIPLQVTCITKQPVTSGNAPDLYSGDTWLETRPKRLISWLRFSWFPSVSPDKFPGITLQLGQDHLFQQPFQFISHCRPVIRKYSVRSVKERNRHAEHQEFIGEF